jgi:short subunit dehydrogenase-like uncharacterized protein
MRAFDSSWMIYGANGYTGERIAREAVARGARPLLAGRNAGRIAELAGELGCRSRAFDVGQAAVVLRQWKEQSETSVPRAVLNCAGPFSATGERMMDACLAAGLHYLDITGEIAVIEAAAARDQQAKAAGVCLIPAVGFDVVPSDCLAAMLAGRLPGAVQLQLAFATSMRLSRGTARTMLERIGQGAAVRREGKIVAVPLAAKTLEVPFSTGRQLAALVPWGDVASAWHTTGIPNIEVYTAMPREQVRQIERWRWLFPAFRLRSVRALLGPLVIRALTSRAAGAGPEDRAAFWGKAQDAQGRSVEATLETPEGYQLTVLTALAAVEKLLAGGGPPGFHTPARAFGADFIRITSRPVL